MKIVHVAQHYNDGFGYHENLLPKYQKKYGHDVMMEISTKGILIQKDNVKAVKREESE